MYIFVPVVGVQTNIVTGYKNTNIGDITRKWFQTKKNSIDIHTTNEIQTL